MKTQMGGIIVFIQPILNLNAHVLFFSVDEQNKSLYCIDDEDQILKYDLKGFL